MKYIILSFWLIASGGATAQSETPWFTYKQAKDTLIFNQAVDLYENNRYTEALKVLDKLPKRHYGQESGSWYLRGQCFYYLEQNDKAIEAFSIALKSEPEATRIYYYRGYAFMESEKYTTALSDFAAYAIHHPKDCEVAINIAYCLSKLDQVDDGIRYLEDFEPKDTTVYFKLSHLYSEYKENYTKGIEMLEKVLAIDSTHDDALHDLSITYYELGNYEKALEVIDRLIILTPNYGKAYYMRGVYEEETGREDLAEVSFKIAREKGYTWDEDEDEYEYEDDNN